MNIISKTFNTLAQIVDKRIATYKVAYDICSKCDVRDRVLLSVAISVMVMIVLRLWQVI